MGLGEQVVLADSIACILYGVGALLPDTRHQLLYLWGLSSPFPVAAGCFALGLFFLICIGQPCALLLGACLGLLIIEVGSGAILATTGVTRGNFWYFVGRNMVGSVAFIANSLGLWSVFASGPEAREVSTEFSETSTGGMAACPYVGRAFARKAFATVQAPCLHAELLLDNDALVTTTLHPSMILQPESHQRP